LKELNQVDSDLISYVGKPVHIFQLSVEEMVNMAAIAVRCSEKKKKIALQSIAE
jgi:hypothetical protein